MRTTLDIPEALLRTAMQASQTKTRTQVIILALEELIRRHNIARLKQFKGKVDLDIDLDQIRGRD